MAYGDPPAQPQQGQGQLPQGQGGQYPDDYYVPYDPYIGKQSNDQALQVREALYGCRMPTADDYLEWLEILSIATDLVGRVPGFDSQIYGELNRDMEDLVDRANSQGRKRIIVSKMQKFVFKLRSLVPKGDIAIAGVTGITAMITSQSSQKQSITMAQPPQPKSPSFLPWNWKWG